MLDKGQEDDWLRLAHHQRHLSIALRDCALILTSLHCGRYARFALATSRFSISDAALSGATLAISFTLMFVLGFCLFGSTVLIPQFVQKSMLGLHGRARGTGQISPGGFGIHSADAAGRLFWSP